jgi:hypothetical protein
MTRTIAALFDWSNLFFGEVMRPLIALPLFVLLIAAAPATKPATLPSTRPTTAPAAKTEAQRRAAWEDIFRGSRRATFEADQKYPQMGPRGNAHGKLTPEIMRAWTKMQGDLAKKYEAAARAKHGITDAEATAIVAEQGEKKWPPPKDAHYVDK